MSDPKSSKFPTYVCEFSSRFSPHRDERCTFCPIVVRIADQSLQPTNSVRTADRTCILETIIPEIYFSTVGLFLLFIRVELAVFIVLLDLLLLRQLRAGSAFHPVAQDLGRIRKTHSVGIGTIIQI